MKQTEIGLIPDDWEVKRLNAICNNISSGKNQNRFVNGIYPVYGSTGIIGFCNNNKYSGDAILVARVGANAGLVNKVAGKYDVSDNTLVIQSDKCDIDYLSRLLAFRNLNQLIFGSGQPLITGGQLKALLIQLPSLTEQQRIAKALSDVDALIFTTEKLLQKKKNIKQGTMQNLLTGKKRLPDFAPVVVEPVETTGYKQTELGLIPEDWEVKALGDFCSIKDGTHGTYNRVENGYYLLSAKNILNGQLDIQDDESMVSESDYLSITANGFPKKGDLLISCVGTIGRCCLFDSDDKIAFQRSVAFIRQNHIDNIYVMYFIQSNLFQNQLRESVNASTLGGVYLGAFNPLIIIYPSSKEEQTAIANVLSSMDKEIETLNAKLEKYRNLKTAMMQQLLNGKIRLR